MGMVPSRLAQWPCQIRLVPAEAPYFDGADLLIAADCSAFAYGNFHADFLRNRIALIGCSQAGEGDYTEKLTQIFAKNRIRSVTLVRMEVPCCDGLEKAVRRALKQSEKEIPLQTVILSTGGKILE